MIFSKLFSSKAKWQHKDSNIRISAIKDDLNTQDTQDIQILKQLAFEDKNDLVRRSALIKLNAFDIWYRAFEQDTDNSVKQFAADNVINLLVAEQTSDLTIKERVAFIKEKMSVPMAETALEKASQTKVIKALLEKINKPHKWPHVFQQTTDKAIQQYLLEKIDDQSILEKLLKKADSKSTRHLISDKIALLERDKLKPVKLLKDAQMVLSKLLALKELHDYEAVLEKRTELNDEWNWLVEDFACLAPHDHAQLKDKFLSINNLLDKSFAYIKEQYEQALIKQKLIEEKQATITHFEEQLAQYDSLLTEAVFENTVIDEAALEKQLEEHCVYVSASILNDEEKAAFSARFNQQLQKIKQLPEIAEAVTKATHLISKMSQQVPPTHLSELAERLVFFNAWKREWKNINAHASSVIPHSIEEAKAQIITQWKEALAPLQKEQQQLFYQAQKKITDLKRLITSGKFNACFGVYKRFDAIYQQLSSEQQQRLQRDYEQLSEKMSELTDWEHYIATPRKQKLLEDIQELAKAPLADVNEQANKVKACRKTWNSLGHADEDIDKELNQAFNEACEIAFAPCRTFYAEQEKLREQHAVVRHDILAQALALNESLAQHSDDPKFISTSLNQLIKQWQDAGEVDRNLYQKLNHKFQKALTPIKAFIKQSHETCAEQKQALINLVIAEHENNDIVQAVNQVKRLQAQWKTIGYAGPKADHKLWAEFRKVNDVVFARRDLDASNTQNEINERIEIATTNLNAVTASLEEANNIDEIKLVQHELDKLKEEELQQKTVAKSVVKKIDDQLKQADAKLEHLTQAKEVENWSNLFVIIQRLIAKEISLDTLENDQSFGELTLPIQKRLVDAISKQSTDIKGTRLDKTIEIEIVAGIESPAIDQAKRMQIQVELMQEKLTSGQVIELDDLFYQWLAVEQLETSDSALLARIKLAYLN